MGWTNEAPAQVGASFALWVQPVTGWKARGVHGE